MWNIDLKPINHNFLGLINFNQGNSSSKPGYWCEKCLKKLSAEKHWVLMLCVLYVLFSPVFVCYGLEDYYRTSKSSNSLKQGGKCLFLFLKKQKLYSQCSSALYLWDSVTPYFPSTDNRSFFPSIFNFLVNCVISRKLRSKSKQNRMCVWQTTTLLILEIGAKKTPIFLPVCE